MSQKGFDILNFETFVAQYMNTNAEPFVFQESAIQIYPLSIALSRIKPPTPLFRTEYNFLLIFLNGGGKQQINNDIIELNPNDILFIREGQLTAINHINPDTNGYYISIDNTALSQIVDNGSLLYRFSFYPKISVTTAQIEWLSKCCELIIAQKTDTTSSERIESALLKAMVLKIAETSVQIASKPDRQTEIAMLFKDLLFNNFIQNKRVKFYADSLSVSENYLNRCVNLVTNKPPKQHINEMAVIYGKVLLQDRSKDVAQIAFDLNFSDPSYFGRLFKQLTKQTPTEYRNSFMQALSE